jgi:GNAT superfamily N-acetyltransferase
MIGARMDNQATLVCDAADQLPSGFQLCRCEDVPKEIMCAFLDRFFGRAKADFLSLHGDWWHRGAGNRLAILHGDKMAAYCAVIPTRFTIGGVSHDAVWWVDLVVAPEYRGRGLQTVFDGRVKAMADLVIGFPNKLAAAIHRKHGWGVREDGHVMLLPLNPRRMRSVLNAGGTRGALLKLGAAALAFPARMHARHLDGYWPANVRLSDSVVPESIAAVFARHRPGDAATTDRTAEYCRWRYLDSPFIDDLRIYLAGKTGDPTLALISRDILHLATAGMETRILDIIGDTSDRALMADLIRTACRDAVRKGAVQVTAISWSREITGALTRRGFVLRTKNRFCWLSDDEDTNTALSRGNLYLSFADSDNDDAKQDE